MWWFCEHHNIHVNRGSPRIGRDAPPLWNPNVERLIKAARGKDVGPTRRFAASPGVGPGATVGTLRIRYPHVQASSQNNGSRLGAATCPRGSGSRLPSRGSSGAATCPHGSGSRLPPRVTWAPAPTIWLMAALELPRVLRTGSVDCKQINKYPLETRPSWPPSGRVRVYLPRHYATRVASHARKACSRRSIKCRWDVWQAGCSDPSQCRVVQQLCATVRLQPSVSVVGHLSATTMCLVTQRHNTVPMAECRVAGDKTQRAHVVEDIIGYS
jgi:hypothetical protein